MPRPGVSYDDVAQSINVLQMTGLNPSIRMIREKLGKGSLVTGTPNTAGGLRDFQRQPCGSIAAFLVAQSSVLSPTELTQRTRCYPRLLV